MKIENGSLIFLAVWVNDLILLAKLTEKLKKIEKLLSQKFKMKDLGIIHYYLGLSVEEENGVLKIHQKQYIQKCFQSLISLRLSLFALHLTQM